MLSYEALQKGAEISGKEEESGGGRWREKMREMEVEVERREEEGEELAKGRKELTFWVY